MKFSSSGYKTAIETEFTIVDKNLQEVPFILKNAQDDFLKQLEIYLKVIVLKARKMGFSSVVLAIMILKFIMGKNEKLVSMSFDASASAKQLERAKHFLRSFELKNGVKIPMKYNTKNELVYEGIDNGRPYINTLRIGTAGSKSFGRGDDITMLHITEFLFCDDIKSLISGVLQALVPGAPTIFESTANGFGEGKDFWDAARVGRNGFKALFYGPEWEYDEEFLAEKLLELGSRLFMQEYPRTPEEAFLTSGECYFDALILGELLQQKKDLIPFQFA